jgi:myo-inositol-1(or 4)-monophosphatase
MVTRSPLINVMAAAAQKAGRFLVRDFGEVEHLQVSLKGPADFVSVADRRAEEVIFRELSKARPRFGFLMEERGVVEGSDTSNRWVVDPLDGTTNFLHGVPHFCVSIALERDGDFLAGVVYQPITDELFWAEKGAGAWVNTRRLRVSARKSMEEAVFALGIPRRALDDNPDFHAQLAALIAGTAGVRRFGSAALDLAYVAAGRFDGYWEPGLSPWDMGAGIVLVREAGGYATAMDGRSNPARDGDIVAANTNLLQPLLSLLQDAARKTPSAKEKAAARP